ncbi:beta-hexosaminidase-like [Mya arenaria]|uniref:beta-hexosaminidase-like n=1 Tax=Mya arenaria TaxID=6604 RepID=UPI0022E81A71|nr:beta-hexosaminidase-like [Mya arenaria]
MVILYRTMFNTGSKRKLVLCIILTVTVVCALAYTYNGNAAFITDYEEVEMDYIATYMQVKVRVEDYSILVVNLTNSGSKEILFGNWRIYFYMLRQGLEVNRDSGFRLEHENGGLHYLEPVQDIFVGIQSGKYLQVTVQYAHVSSTSDVFPNWYVASSTNTSPPKTIKSTKGDDVRFMEPFNRPDQWKRGPGDTYNPYSAADRYHYYDYLHSDLSDRYEDSVFPTPMLMHVRSDNTIQIDNTWSVMAHNEDLNIAKHLSSKLNINHKSVASHTPCKYCINLQRNNSYMPEEYSIDSQTRANTINILYKNSTGAFYAVQTFLQLLSDAHSVKDVFVRDKPRFPYRGFMVDVARNFISKRTILKLLDAMARYKLNTLHMHLSDDEGWRLEIPSLPELTKFTARRCHYLENTYCLNSSLGSGPYSSNSGSGFYTVKEFREILQYAQERFITVIPEIDMPGHSLAAVTAMKYREGNKDEEGSSQPSYMLVDPGYSFVGMNGWKGANINPCLNASYRFVDTLFEQLSKIYEGVQPLDTIHIGADEVPNMSWDKSAACMNMFGEKEYTYDQLKDMFTRALSDIALRHGVRIAAWEDGLYKLGVGPYKRSGFKQKEMYVNAWNTIWEQGKGKRAIEFANAGYHTILSMATHLYFDHPYEPDPLERGLYWATRFIDTFKVFKFMPDDIFANADVNSMGNIIDRDTLCSVPGNCPELIHPENIIGMEACVWGETIRTEEDFFFMVFPRLLAYAERSWHKAEWESIKNTELRVVERAKDWDKFLSTISQNELPWLETNGLSYRLPPPGALVSEQKKLLKVNTLYKNLQVEVSMDAGKNWKHVPEYVKLGKSKSILLRTKSNVSKRVSREISYIVTSSRSSASFDVNHVFNMLLLIAVIRLFKM